MASNVWYELEYMPLCEEINPFYPVALMNRSDENAGVDMYTSADVHVGTTPDFIPFGLVARLIKVEPMPHGLSDEYLKTDSHFFLLPRSSIYKTGLMMANSTGVIDKSYRGELKAPVWSMTGDSSIRAGERLFQIVAPDMGWIRSIRRVDYMSETSRGAGGFGSSGV